MEQKELFEDKLCIFMSKIIFQQYSYLGQLLEFYTRQSIKKKDEINYSNLEKISEIIDTIDNNTSETIKIFGVYLNDLNKLKSKKILREIKKISEILKIDYEYDRELRNLDFIDEKISEININNEEYFIFSNELALVFYLEYFQKNKILDIHIFKTSLNAFIKTMLKITLNENDKVMIDNLFWGTYQIDIFLLNKFFNFCYFEIIEKLLLGKSENLEEFLINSFVPNKKFEKKLVLKIISTPNDSKFQKGEKIEIKKEKFFHSSDFYSNISSSLNKQLFVIDIENEKFILKDLTSDPFLSIQVLVNEKEIQLNEGNLINYNNSYIKIVEIKTKSK